MPDALLNETAETAANRKEIEKTSVVLMLRLGDKLPRCLGRMPLALRGHAVGLLHQYLDLPPEVVGHLITSPETVEFRLIPVKAEGDADEAEIDKEIYEAARAIEKSGHDVGPLLGLSGLDWPPGSGDYHGGAPLPNDDPAELLRRYAQIAKAFADIEKSEKAKRAGEN